MPNYNNIYETEKKSGYFLAEKYNDLYNSLFYETIRAFICKKVLINFKGSELRILDIGCGPGNLLKHFSKRLYHNIHFYLYGVDISLDMLRVTKRNIPGAKVCVGVAEGLPFSSNSFDVVIGFSALHHLPCLRSFWEETGRVLRPNGFFIFGEPHKTVLDSNALLRRLIKLPFSLVYLMFNFKNRKRATILKELPLSSFETEVHRHISINELKKSLVGLPFEYGIERLGMISSYLGAIMFPEHTLDRSVFGFLWTIDLLCKDFFKKISTELLVYGYLKK